MADYNNPTEYGSKPGYQNQANIAFNHLLTCNYDEENFTKILVKYYTQIIQTNNTNGNKEKINTMILLAMYYTHIYNLQEVTKFI